MFSPNTNSIELKKNNLLLHDIVNSYFQDKINSSDSEVSYLSLLWVTCAINSALNSIEVLLFGGNNFSPDKTDEVFIPEDSVFADIYISKETKTILKPSQLASLDESQIIEIIKLTILLFLVMFLKDPANITFSKIDRIITGEKKFIDDIFGIIHIERNHEKIYRKIMAEFNDGHDKPLDTFRFATYIKEVLKPCGVELESDNHEWRAFLNLILQIIYPHHYEVYARKLINLLNDLDGNI